MSANQNSKVLKLPKQVALDCNIFIYYFEGNPEFGSYSKKIFDALNAKTFIGVTSIISLIELLSKKSLPEHIAKELEKDFLEIPNISILEVNQKIAVRAARIRRKYDFRLPDSIYLATAVEAKADIFITNDQRLKQFKEIKIELISSLKFL